MLSKKKIFSLVFFAVLFSQCAHAKWVEGKIAALDSEKKEMWVLKIPETRESPVRKQKAEMMAVSPEAVYEGVENFEALTLGSRVLLHYYHDPDTGKWQVIEIVKRNSSL